MIETLTSDPAIVFFTGIGLVATGVSILRDARDLRRIPERLNAVDDEVAIDKIAA